MSKKIQFHSFALTALSAVPLAISGCANSSSSSGSTGATISSVGLDSLPSASSMVATNSGGTSSRVRHNGRLENASVGANVPLVTSLKANADADFWNGLVATIEGFSSGPGAGYYHANIYPLSQEFWGEVDGGPGGNGACYMAQSVGESFGRMLENGTSMCYMKNIPEAASGFTITSGGVAKADLFSQGAEDRLVKIDTGSQDVYIKIYGTNTVTSDVYKVRLHFCTSSVVTGKEQVEVNKASGLYSASSVHSESGGTELGNSSISAYLKQNADGTLAFDPSKDRVATSSFHGTWGDFKSEMTITPANYIYSKMRNVSSWGSNSTYSISGFSGSSFATLKFNEAGYKGTSSYGSSSQNFSGGTEWNGSYYASRTSSDLKTSAELMDFTADTFFNSSMGTPDTSDLSSLNCTDTPDVTATMDFTDSAIIAIQTTCEGDRFTDYDMCNGASVQDAMNKIFQSYDTNN